MYLALKNVFASNNTGISPIKKQQQINIYPNPNNGIFKLKLKNDAVVFIYNTKAELIYSENIYKESEQSIDISDQQPGMYLIKIVHKNEIIIGKFIIY